MSPQKRNNPSRESKKKLKGYGFSRPWNEQFVPQRIQNMLIRQFIEGMGHEFLLSAFEYHMEKSTMMLRAQIEDMDSFDGLVFFSLYQLPGSYLEREAFFEKIFDSDKELHFALEGLQVQSLEEVQFIEEILMANSLSKRALENLSFLPLRL